MTGLEQVLSGTREVGFIGIGRMGTPMVGRLLKAGYRVVVYDVSAPALDRVRALGAEVAASPAEVASAVPVVLLSLPTPSIAEKALFGAGGIVEGTRRTVVMDFSTIGRVASERIAARLAEHDVALIDTPVSGGVAGAEAGTLALMVAAPEAVYTAARPILDVIGTPMHAGDAAGMGQMMKVLNNLVSLTNLAIASEALVLGTRAGLDPARLVEALNSGSGRSAASESKIPNFVLSGRFDFGFSIALSAKDTRICLEEAEQLAVPMHIGATVREALTAARAMLGEDADQTEIIRPMEARVGVEARSAK